MFGSKYRKYEKRLIELVSIALNKNSFEDLVKNVSKGKSIDHIKPESTEGFTYIEKILTEEIEKQFGDPNRPFIELVLNAIDARSDEHVGDYVVTVLTKFNEFIVSDNGKSMSLGEVLSNFIIPFYSQKSSVEDIGRFGVGFLSNLSFCLEEPRLIYVKVNICKGKDAFRIMFFSESENVRDIIVSIERVEPLRQGTDVIITRDIKKAPGLLDYLMKYLNYFNPDVAKIKINRSFANFPQKGETIIRKFPFKKDGKTTDQVMRATIDLDAPEEEQYLRMYSQGVFIFRKKINFGSINVDLPSIVDVVEGRDEFKQDETYNSSLENIWQLILMDLKKVDMKETEVINKFREFIPALEEGLGVSMRFKEEFIKILFPRKTYVVDSNATLFKEKDFKNIVDFFGQEIYDYLYQPKHELSEQRWRQILGTSKSLIDEFSEVITQGFLSICINHIKNRDFPFHNTDFLKEKVYYRVVKIQTHGGISAFLKVGEIIYINIDSKFFKIENDFISNFNNQVYFLRASGLSESEIGKRFK